MWVVRSIPRKENGKTKTFYQAYEEHRQIPGRYFESLTVARRYVRDANRRQAASRNRIGPPAREE